MKLSFSIAKRFLAYNKGQTLLIVLGIAIGISVQIFIGLLISGLQDSLVDSTIGSTPHITIASEIKGESFTVNEELFKIYQEKEEFSLVGQSVTGAAFAIGEEQSQSIVIRGLDSEALKIANIESKIEKGNFRLYDRVMIGKGIADQLEVKVGDLLEIKTVQNQIYKIEISAILDLKVAALNDAWVIVRPEVAQKILMLEDQVTAIEIQVKDVFNADVLASNMSVREGLEVIDWKAQNEELLSGLNGQSVSTIMIQIFVLVSVVLGIASTLAITVLQKSKQIGILKAMGIYDSNASLIFMFQGLILGFFGGLLGMAFGYGLLEMFSSFAKGSDGQPIIPITLDVPFILFSGSIAIVSALVASLIPARKSRKLSVIEVIRNG
jgi:lipoprotein-releasing system permease protein